MSATAAHLLGALRESLDSPGWRFNPAHARAAASEAVVDPAANAGPVFSAPELAAQRAAADALLADLAAAPAGSTLSLGPDAHYLFAEGATLAAPADGVTLAGRGATLWVESADPSRPPGAGLTLAAGADATLTDLVLDSRPHGCAQGAVTAVDRANGLVVLAPHADSTGFPALTAAGADRAAAWWSAASPSALAPLGALRVATTDVATADAGVLTLRGAGLPARLDAAVGPACGAGPAVGDVAVLCLADAPLLTVAASCRRAALSNVRAHSGGRAVLDLGNATTMEDVVVGRRPGSGRLLACAGDGLVVGPGASLRACEVGWVRGNCVDAGGWGGVVCAAPTRASATVAVHPLGGPPATGADARLWNPCCGLLGRGNLTSVAASANASAALAATAAAVGANLAGWATYDVALDAEVPGALTRGSLFDPLRAGDCHVDGCYLHHALGGWGLRAGSANSATVSDTYLAGCGAFLGAEARTAYRGFPRSATVTSSRIDGGRLVAGALTTAPSQLPAPGGGTATRLTVRGCVVRGGPAALQAYHASGSVVDTLVAADRPSRSFPCATCDVSVPLADVTVAVGGGPETVALSGLLGGGAVADTADLVRDLPPAPFSLAWPAGPTFTAGQKAAHKAAGAALWAQVAAAAADPLVPEFVVPPGDYGFDQGAFDPRFRTSPCALWDGVRRPDASPFLLTANGATFWADTTVSFSTPAAMFAVWNSNNVHVRGLTLESYSPQGVEGVLAAVDVPGNRLAVDLLPGSATLPNAAVVANNTHVVGCKPDGAAIASMYRVNAGWGPGATWVRRVDPDPVVSGRLWYGLDQTSLLTAMYTPAWYDAHGLRGTLCPGDGVCFNLQRAVCNFDIQNCRNVRVTDCTAYGGFLLDNGGHGGHVFTRFAQTRRPGTNAVVRGSAQLGGRARVGSVYEACHMGPSTDDHFNIMALNDSRATALAGNVVTLSLVPSALLPGDAVEFFDSVSGAPVANALVTAVPPDPRAALLSGAQVTLDPAPPSTVLTGNATVRAYFPSARSAGWAVRGCTLDSAYQRLLFQTGPGEFSNNLVRGMGFGMVLSSNFSAETEGGTASGIVVANNAFLECGPGWLTPVVGVTVAPLATGTRTRGTVVRDNVFLGCGGAAVYGQHLTDAVVENNVVVDALRRNRLVGATATGPTAVQSTGSAANVRVRGNRVVHHAPTARAATCDPVVDAPPFVNGVLASNNAAIVDVARTAYDAGYRAYRAGGHAAGVAAAVRAALAGA